MTACHPQRSGKTDPCVFRQKDPYTRRAVHRKTLKGLPKIDSPFNGFPLSKATVGIEPTHKHLLDLSIVKLHVTDTQRDMTSLVLASNSL